MIFSRLFVFKFISMFLENIELGHSRYFPEKYINNSVKKNIRNMHIFLKFAMSCMNRAEAIEFPAEHSYNKI